MRRFYFADQDATIYQQFPTRTTGVDEILEVGKTNPSNSAHAFIQFDISQISASISNGTFPISTQYDLVLRLANSELIVRGQNVELYTVSSSWSEGQGYFYQDRIVEPRGITWNNRDAGSTWVTAGGDVVSLIATASMSLPVADMTITITSAINSWLSGSISNNGLLLKFPAADESDVSNLGLVQFFSKDSHTIHRPVLVAKWDDSVYVTGSYTSSIGLDEIKVQAQDLAPSYLPNETPRVFLNVRQLYPVKTFADQFTSFSGVYYLPTSSYFSLVDAQSNTEIITADQYSKIKINGSGSYIDFATDALYPLRFYQFRYRIERNGRIEWFTDPRTFTIRQI